MERFGRNKWKLTRAMIEDAPSTRGVYALWENDELVCIGRADGGEETIRACLLRHLEGAEASQGRHATHYTWEICIDPEARERELLRQLPERADAALRPDNVRDLRRAG